MIDLVTSCGAPKLHRLKIRAILLRLFVLSL